MFLANGFEAPRAELEPFGSVKESEGVFAFAVLS